MRGSIWSTTRALLWPAALPLLAAALYVRAGDLSVTDESWGHPILHFLLGAAVLLSLRFGGSRVAAIAALVWFGLIAVCDLSGVDRQCILFCVAIGFLVVACLPERGGISWSAILMMCPVVVVATFPLWPMEWRAPLHGFVGTGATEDVKSLWDVSWPVLTAYGCVLLAQSIRLSRSLAPVDSGLMGALVAWLAIFYTGGDAARIFELCLSALIFLTALETIHALAFRDQLTGLPSRRALDRATARLGGRYTLAMVDVDFFKKFNDKYGHDAGDEALRMVAGHLRNVRGGGRAYRYGGEEFAVVFPGVELGTAEEHLETLRQSIADARFTLRAPGRPKRKPPPKKRRSTGRGKVKLTVSIGAAQRSPDVSTVSDVMKAADKSLYKAKRAGRNRLVSA